MRKRIAILTGLFAVSICCLMFKLYSISQDEYIIMSGISQSAYEVGVADFRGTIYDCKKTPMVNNGDIQTIISVLPDEESMGILKAQLKHEEFLNIYPYFNNDKPFILKTEEKVLSDSDKIISFPVNKRYHNNEFCCHIIGHCSESGKGLSGIEKSMEEYLNVDSEITVNYIKDAKGDILNGYKTNIKDSEDLKYEGVALTIDSEIQKIAQEAAKKHIEKGAVVITEVPSCQIRAMLSLPSYQADNVKEYLDREDSPLLNRALCAYDIGSVFKVVTAAYILENGLYTDDKYNCVGSIELSKNTFDCFNKTAHGQINLEEAFAHSCNGYFVNISSQIDKDKFLKLANNFGFGKSYELSKGLGSNQGYLPSKDELRSDIAMANFSFGQGAFLATPLQVATMINTIASDGEYTAPTLLKGLINSDKEEYMSYEVPISKKVISTESAKKIQQYMSLAVEYGTAMSGRSETTDIAAKTGTAQTGQVVNGEDVQQCWYAGFFPKDNPRYSITVFCEDAESVALNCAPVFKEIAEKIDVAEN
ncbi:MAG: penicillin-binding protein 2 [Clostridia bacterium]|nr:penicillin-binding protein 2 [Clostridia bacterium]